MSKLIAVSEEVYDELSEIKEGKSFTETIKRLLEEKKKNRKHGIKNMEKFFGTIDNKTAKAWKLEIEEGRKNFASSRQL